MRTAPAAHRSPSASSNSCFVIVERPSMFLFLASS